MATDITTEVDYPTGDGKPMAETQTNAVAMMLLTQALQDFFRDRPDVFVFTDQFWYWEKGNPKAVVAPDVFVITGTRPRPLGERDCFFSWDEPKAVPAAVFEMASRNTWREDVGPKHQTYEKLGVREYFIFDPKAIYLEPQLQGFRLRGGRYRAMREEQIASQLGFEIRVEDTNLRLIDKQTGQPIPTREERAEAEKQRAEAEEQRAEAEEQRAEAEKQRAEAEKQRAESEKQRAESEKQRADGLQAEVERLRAMIQKPAKTNGTGA